MKVIVHFFMILLAFKFFGPIWFIVFEHTISVHRKWNATDLNVEKKDMIHSARTWMYLCNRIRSVTKYCTVIKCKKQWLKGIGGTACHITIKAQKMQWYLLIETDDMMTFQGPL